jgi:hypothetical protein
MKTKQKQHSKIILKQYSLSNTTAENDIISLLSASSSHLLMQTME